MQEILAARQLSHYLLADFQYENSSNLVTLKICGEDKIEQLALGQTYEIIAKCAQLQNDDLYKTVTYQCVNLVEFEIPTLKIFESLDLNMNLGGLFKAW